MTDEERCAFENLILLCPGHHKLVDRLEPEKFSVEVLRAMKDKAVRRVEVEAWADDASLTRLAQAAITYATGVLSGAEERSPEQPPSASRQQRRQNLIVLEECLVDLEASAKDYPQRLDSDGAKGAQARMTSYLLDLDDVLPISRKIAAHAMPWAQSDLSGQIAGARHEIRQALEEQGA